jgi:alpha-L-rhamnosidase
MTGKNKLRSDWFLGIISLLFVAGCTDVPSCRLEIEKLLTDYAEKPYNIESRHPEFSWVISPGKRNQNQSAYRILVASSAENISNNKPDLWDSGKTESHETTHHAYLPDNLKSDSKYFWKVIVWDQDCEKCESQVSEFHTSLLENSDWSGKWIGSADNEGKIPANGFYSVPEQDTKSNNRITHNGRSLLLRYEATLEKEIISATAFVTGLGYFEFFVNGKRIGDHFLSPAKTPYHKYVLYDSWDILPFLRKGQNAFGIHLGNGWFNPYKKWWNMYRMQWFGHKMAIAEIHLKYIDGTEEIIKTDENWSSAPGPVIFNCVYDGEVYDARQEKQGWAEPGFDQRTWRKVREIHDFHPVLVSSTMPPVKENEHFTPRRVDMRKGNSIILDMRQNFAGWIKISAKGRRGAILRIRFAEELKPDSTLDVTSNEKAAATAVYILKGDSVETYEPHFTWFGFRYAEITVSEGPADILNAEGLAVYSSNKTTGSFDCGNELVNKIHRATVWSQKSNMIGYPMDCPQRDERLGWMGDAQVTAEEAMFNFDMALFYRNWLQGIRVNQNANSGDIPIISPRPYIYDDGVEWSSTYFLLLKNYYTFYGDLDLLRHHYGAMEGYMDFLDSLSGGKVLKKGWIGDWGSMAEGWREGDPPSVPTAYYFLDSRILSEISALAGKSSGHEKFTDLAETLKRRYNKSFLDTLTFNYDDGSQMANAFPLWLNIVPPGCRDKVLENLLNDISSRHDFHFTTGVLGTKYLPEVLAETGHADAAWKIITQETAPSWNEMMKKYTTMCEFWTLKQSKNHVMMGSIDSWFYKYLAGIQPDPESPGFLSFSIRPFFPEGLDHASAEIETIRGKISSSWIRKDGRLTMEVNVPFNTKAKICIPGGPADKITESGNPVSKAEGISAIEYKDQCSVVTVGSGRYVFSVPWPAVGNVIVKN